MTFAAGLSSLAAIELHPAPTASQPTPREAIAPASPPPGEERGFPFWAVWIALAAVGVAFYMPVVNLLMGDAVAMFSGGR